MLIITRNVADFVHSPIALGARRTPETIGDAAGAADLRRDAVGALLDPAGRFGIDRGTVAKPLHDGVQVCQDLRVDAGGFGFGGAHPRLRKRVAGLSLAAEEILASLVGVMVCREEKDRETLYAKAAAQLLEHGQTPEQVTRQLQALCDLLVRLL
jgi:hypothetical protein